MKRIFLWFSLLCVVILIINLSQGVVGADSGICDNESGNLSNIPGEDCRSDSDCISGVCNFIKQDYGTCANITCIAGTVIQGLSNTSFFCNQDMRWEKTRPEGGSCTADCECEQITCKDAPGCHPGDYHTRCLNGTCTTDKNPDPCMQKGLVSIVSREDADVSMDGSCVQTMAQRELKTVCAPCGDGICETPLESVCNCPKDCLIRTDVISVTA